MKLLLVTLFLILPLTSTAAAYRWMDENGNVHFGSKPSPAKQEPALKIPPKIERKAPMKKLPEPNGADTAVANDKSPVSTADTQPAKSAPEPQSGAIGSTPKPESAKPVENTRPASSTIVVTPAPKSKPLPKTKTKAEVKPITKPVKQDSKPPVSRAVKPTPKKQVTKPAPKVNKKVIKSPPPKPAKKRAVEKKRTSKPVASTVSEDRNAELCGMFTNYVSDYQNKLIDCQGASCTIYERSLAKYQKKKETYCH